MVIVENISWPVLTLKRGQHFTFHHHLFLHSRYSNNVSALSGDIDLISQANMAHVTLFALSSELLMQIVLMLDYHDRVQLNATCTHLNKIVEPFIWTNLEFHFAGYHESSFELDDPPPHIPVSERAYQHRLKPEGRGHMQASNKANRFLNLLAMYYMTDRSRLQKICSRVKHLCTGVCYNWHRWMSWPVDYNDTGISFWNILPSFNNLTTLELHADSGYGPSVETKPSSWDIQAPPLPKLCFVKLFGYIPSEVVRLGTQRW